MTAAYRPVRELLQQEREKDKVLAIFLSSSSVTFTMFTHFKQCTMILIQEKQKKDSEGSSSEDASSKKEEDKEEERVIALRSLNMEDMRQAKNQVT